MRPFIRCVSTLVLCAVLVACDAAPDAPAGIVSIDGRVSARSPMPDAVGFPPFSVLPQERVPVGPDGAFSLPLPARPSTQRVNWADPTCAGAVDVSRPDAEYLSVDALQVFANGSSLGGVRTYPRGAQSVRHEYVFATVDAVVRGEQVCPSTERYSFDLAFRAGWNLMRIEVGADGLLVYRTVSAATLNWF